ncbi:mobile mystery protein A [soil metagenome]
MTANMRLLKVRRLDRAIEPLMKGQDTLHQKRGWIREIRTALGMTSEQLARRMRINQSSLSKIEKNEEAGTVSLKTLRKAASALDCELVYTLVPRKPFETALRDRITRIAMEQVARVGHTMRLEDQPVPEHQLSEQVAEIVSEMMMKPPRSLWD